MLGFPEVADITSMYAQQALQAHQTNQRTGIRNDDDTVTKNLKMRTIKNIQKKNKAQEK